jgi:hypothetical protein
VQGSAPQALEDHHLQGAGEEVALSCWVHTF